MASKTTSTGGMDANQFREAAHAAIEEIIAYNNNIESYPVLPQIKPGYLAPQLPKTAPDTPEAWSTIQPDIATKIIPGLTHWQSPRFMAFFPACVTYPSMLGEMYSAAFNAPAFNWLCSPACTELETVVTDWLCRALSLPPTFLSTSPNGGGGTIQGSASEAIVTCMVAARERYIFRKCSAEGLSPDTDQWEQRVASLRGRLVALASDQTHSSTQKGARIAGTRFHAIATSPTQNFSLSAPNLTSALQDCKARGLEPYYITLTLGTTSTCSVDDFASLTPLLQQHPDIWVHVDAAYAGAALILPQFAQRYSHHMSLADSFNMNMHKWLLVNFDASMLYVQNRSDLTRALSISAAYYENSASDSGLVTDYRDWQIPLGRRFRALKIWFVMRSFGIAGMGEHVSRTVLLGELFAGLVREKADVFEIVAEPGFALTCFRLRPAFLDRLRRAGADDGADGAAGDVDVGFVSMENKGQEMEVVANALTKQVTDLINERGEVFLTGSTAGGKTFIRVVSANSRAEEKYIREAWDVIVKTTEEVLGRWKEGSASVNEVVVNGH
jgi:aromatic-L-amino-acid/L-tryptophan decarboxylase